MPTIWQPRPVRPLSPTLQVIVADLQQLEAILPPGKITHVATLLRQLLRLWQPAPPRTRPRRRPRRA